MLIVEFKKLKEELIGNKIECKVCMDNVPNMLMRPCKHLICEICYRAWCEINKNTCPFCKQDVNEAEKIDFLNE